MSNERAEILLRLAAEAGITITTAESCTGGMVAAAITDIPGSSAIFERGFVTYSNEAKTDMLGVVPKLIAAHGAVSEPVAKAMAEGALAKSLAQLSIAITGIAGPGGTANKPEGRVCFGLAREQRDTSISTIDFGALGRPTVRERARDHALDLLIEACRAQETGAP